MDFTEKQSFIELIKKVHAGQTRAGDVPVWHHLARVAELLELILNDTKEGAPEEREAIILACFGHDALEDTKIAREDIEKYGGKRCLALIEGMTNKFGDNHTEPYVEQVATAPEGVRLIKLSDLYDNCTSVTYNLFVLGAKWTEEYFLPIVEPMIVAVTTTKFDIYPETAARLKNMVKTSHNILLNELARFKTKLTAG